MLISKNALPLNVDLLRGVAKIAEHIGESERRVYYLCEHDLIPVFKVGAIWHSRKSVLNRHYGGEM